MHFKLDHRSAHLAKIIQSKCTLSVSMQKRWYNSVCPCEFLCCVALWESASIPICIKDKMHQSDVTWMPLRLKFQANLFVEHILQAINKEDIKFFNGVNPSVVGGFGSHDDVIKWKHFPSDWPFVGVIYRSLMNPPTHPKSSQWRFEVFFICAWTNDWANKLDAGHSRRHRAHYDVTVMHKGSIIELQETFPCHGMAMIYNYPSWLSNIAITNILFLSQIHSFYGYINYSNLVCSR